MKFLAWFNVVGILALAALCTVQWENNRRANVRAQGLDKLRQEHEKKIAEQDRTIGQCRDDIEDLRGRLERTKDSFDKANVQIATLTSERDHVTAERDRTIARGDQLTADLKQTQETLAKFVAAVNEQNESLKKANGEIKALAKQRDDQIAKFNELAVKYNALVKEASKGNAPK